MVSFSITLKDSFILTDLAVKCNPEPKILKLLARLGVGFDCASMTEIESVCKETRVHPSRILYAHPRKEHEQAMCAVDRGVQHMTCDSVQELEMATQHYPTAKLLIRILTNDSDSICPLSEKFGAGAPFDKTEKLLRFARSKNLNIVGVSFHVGSGGSKPESFLKAIKDSRDVFDLAKQFGYDCNILDIGGGFTHDLFEDQAEYVNIGLEKYFSSDGNFTIISEPGRFYVSSAYLLATRVIGTKVPEKSGQLNQAYINEGVYGTLQNTISDHQIKVPKFLRKQNPSITGLRYKIWGPTCDSYDRITDCEMQGTISPGDWLYFEDMGAYTIPCATPFNGIRRDETIYFNSKTGESVTPGFWSSFIDALSDIFMRLAGKMNVFKRGELANKGRHIMSDKYAFV